MRFRNLTASVAAAALVSGCASTFVSTWSAPDARPLQLRGAKVAAVVMMTSEATRRAAEDALARQITARGAIGVPMYTVLPDVDPVMEETARAQLERAGFQGAVVMRPIRIDKEVVSTPSAFSDPWYGSYWGGYYGLGWRGAWGPDFGRDTEIRTNTVVSVETLIYSLTQNRLVWGGQSKTTNPGNVNRFVKSLSRDVAMQLEKSGLLAKQ